jgi:hypothetical protein
MVGGAMVCWGAIRRWVFFMITTSSGSDDEHWVRPITSASPSLARQALAAGILILICASGFILLRRNATRIALMFLLLLTGIWVVATFHELQLDDPLRIVPSELRGGLSLCPAAPCIEVIPLVEWIEWGAWVALFWGALAMVRALVPPRTTEVSPAVSRFRNLSDARVLVWLVAATLAIAFVLYVGFIILYGLFAGDAP